MISPDLFLTPKSTYGNFFFYKFLRVNGFEIVRDKKDAFD